jgi:hypothetical protein
VDAIAKAQAQYWQAAESACQTRKHLELLLDALDYPDLDGNTRRKAKELIETLYKHTTNRSIAAAQFENKVATLEQPTMRSRALEFAQRWL